VEGQRVTRWEELRDSFTTPNYFDLRTPTVFQLLNDPERLERRVYCREGGCNRQEEMLAVKSVMQGQAHGVTPLTRITFVRIEAMMRDESSTSCLR
jgi:hypothetical protein